MEIKKTDLGNVGKGNRVKRNKTANRRNLPMCTEETEGVYLHETIIPVMILGTPDSENP